MKIYRVTDPEFKAYGRVIATDSSEIIAEAAKLEMPAEGASYEPSIPALEATSAMAFYTDEIYGEMPIQIGCCWGHNNVMNALEWHRDSEINIAVTDFVLILARLEDLDADGRLDSAKCKMFQVKAGETVEVYATSLHFCPCTTEAAGFNCIVVLPKGTNVALDKKPADPLLFRKNKWIICHESAEGLVSRGVVPGIYGENWVIE
ncbi:MAG: DUF4867 family protein [Planctomycetia bacterium]|nr:DUF4867 family protein [Planctomycetia bacterium]